MSAKIHCVRCGKEEEIESTKKYVYKINNKFYCSRYQ